MRTPRISIGIFAHQEESCIADALTTLSGQSLLGSPDVEVLVLENGSRDRTAEVAEAACARLFDDPGRAQARVLRLPVGDKANTWNTFVHGESHSDAEVLVFLDADIRIHEPDALEKVVAALEEETQAWVAVDAILKDIALQENPSLRGQISLSASQLTQAGAPPIAGSLYAGKAASMRTIVMPCGLLVEDGFLRAMVLRDSFRDGEEDFRRVIRAPGASHSFRALSRIGEIYRHEKRLAIGSAINTMLFDLIVAMHRDGEDPAQAIRERNQRDRDWVREMTSEMVKEGRFRFMSGAYIRKPFRQLRSLGMRAGLRHLPTAVLKSCFHVAIAMGTRRSLKRGDWAW